MKLVVFACLLALALARPQDPATANTLRSENINEGLGDGIFNYHFATDQGIEVEAAGTPGSEGQSNINGRYKFSLGDGRTVEVVYLADEGGFRPQVTLS